MNIFVFLLFLNFGVSQVLRGLSIRRRKYFFTSIPASDPKHGENKKKHQKLIKSDGFDQNGGRHELRHKKMMHFDPADVDFRATATEIIKNLSKTMVLTKTAAAMSSGTKK